MRPQFNCVIVAFKYIFALLSRLLSNISNFIFQAYEDLLPIDEYLGLDMAGRVRAKWRLCPVIYHVHAMRRF